MAYNKMHTFSASSSKSFTNIHTCVNTATMKIQHMVIYFRKFSHAPWRSNDKATTDLISTIIIRFGCSRTLYKWDHTVRALLSLASFVQHNVSEMHSCCYMYP